MALFEKKTRTLGEIEEENEKEKAEDELLGTQLSALQKRVAIAELSRRGLKPSHFGKPSNPSTWSKIWTFLKGDSLGITKIFKK